MRCAFVVLTLLARSVVGQPHFTWTSPERLHIGAADIINSVLLSGIPIVFFSGGF